MGASVPPPVLGLEATAAELVEQARLLLREDSVHALDIAVSGWQAAQVAGDTALRADAAMCVAQAHFNLGALDGAFEHVHLAIGLWREMGRADGESRARSLQAQCLQEMGQEKEALEEALAALRLADGAGSPRSRAEALMALGYAYRSVGHPEAARSTFAEVAAVARGIPDLLLRSRALSNVASTWGDNGFTLLEKGQLEQAHRRFRIAYRLYERALRMCRQLDHKRLESIILGNMGLSLVDQGRHVEALGLLQDLCRRAQASGSRQIEEMAQRFIGETCLAAGQAAEAIESLQVALAIAEETQRHESAMHSHKLLSQAQEARGNPSEALRHFRQYHELYTRVQSEASDRRARAVAVQMETEKAKTAVRALLAQAQQLEHENQRLTQEASELSQATVTDPLTGLLNRRGLDAAMARAMIRRHETRAISIAVVDLDHFKRINDSFSHLTGDEVLRAIGSILRSCCREGDVAARYGGEEFAVIFGKTSVEEARIACERMRSAIRGHDWRGIHPQLAVSASIGVADTTEAQGEALLALADRRLYAAKKSGRDRVVSEGDG